MPPEWKAIWFSNSAGAPKEQLHLSSGQINVRFTSVGDALGTFYKSASVPFRLSWTLPNTRTQTKATLSSELQPRKHDPAWCCLRVVESMKLGFEITLFGLEDIFHPGLRVSIDEGKPGALDLDHQAVPSFERVVHVAQRNVDTGHTTWNKWFRLLHVVAKSSSHHAGTNQLLKSALKVLGDWAIESAMYRLAREFIDQLDDHIRRLSSGAEG